MPSISDLNIDSLQTSDIKMRKYTEEKLLDGIFELTSKNKRLPHYTQQEIAKYSKVSSVTISVYGDFAGIYKTWRERIEEVLNELLTRYYMNSDKVDERFFVRLMQVFGKERKKMLVIFNIEHPVVSHDFLNKLRRMFPDYISLLITIDVLRILEWWQKYSYDYKMHYDYGRLLFAWMQIYKQNQVHIERIMRQKDEKLKQLLC